MASAGAENVPERKASLSPKQVLLIAHSVCGIALLGALLEMAASQAQASASTGLEHAIALIAEARYREAQEILERIAESTGSASDGQVHYQLAICLVKQRQWAKAEHALKISFERSPPNPPAIFLSAFILFHRARYNESLA